VLPELDDEFFTLFDVKEGGLEAFREEVKSNMQRELDASIKAKVKNQVMDGLDATNELELPQALLDEEVNRMRQEAVQQFGGGQGAPQIDPSVLPAEMFSDQAGKRVKLALIINAIVEKNELAPDEDKVRETIETMASSYEDPEQVINFYYSNEQQLSQIRNVVLEEQIVDLVLETAKVSEKAVSYEEAVSREEALLDDDEADSEDSDG
jgi:trigger factor